MAGDFVQMSLLDLLEGEAWPKLKEWAYGVRSMSDLMNKGGYSRDQAKVLRAGFCLAKYTRELKQIEFTCTDPLDGWAVLDGFPTYAAVERKLKEILDQPEYVATGDDGTIGGSTNLNGKLQKAGFEFYRVYGLHEYHTDFRIKMGSKNWATFKKCDSKEQLLSAWDKLMETDMKALKG